MFCWSSKDRLRPLRMVWLSRNHNSPKYELVKWRQPSLRKQSRGTRALPKVDDSRETRLRYPRMLDEHGVKRYPKRNRK
jgi:hypothetical protein